MRDYGTVESTFWTRGSGKALRDDPIARLAALYVMTAPGANMIGIYYLPIPTLAHDLGIEIEAPSKPLRSPSEGVATDAKMVVERLRREQLAFFDDVAELVWVPKMAAKQVGEKLKLSDHRRTAILRLLDKVGNHRFVDEFIVLYGDAYHLTDRPSRRPSKAPSKPLRSPSQGASLRDQDQDQEQDQGERERASTPAGAPHGEPPAADGESVDPPRIDPPVGGESRPSELRVRAGAAIPTLMPDDLEASDETVARCIMAGFPNPRPLMEAFKAHHRAKGSQSASWQDSIFTWARNERAFGPRPPGGGGPRGGKPMIQAYSPPPDTGIRPGPRVVDDDDNNADPFAKEFAAWGLDADRAGGTQ